MYRLIAALFIALATVTASVEPTVAQQQRDRVLYVNNPGGALNLRTGPGTNYPIILSMPHGTQIMALGRRGEWIRVRHPSGATGFTYVSYLRQRPPRF